MKTKHIIIFSILTIMLTIFTFVDLEISKWIVNDKSIFGYIYEVIGEIPVYLGVVLFGVTMFNLVKKESTKILSVLITFIGSLLFIVMPARYLPFFNGVTAFILACLSILLSSLILFFSKKIPEDFYNKALPVVCIYFIVCCLGPALVFAIKTFVGRVRFEDLNASYSNFTRWYVVNGITGNHSFPSGHTCSAATIICLNNLTKSFNFSKKQKALLYTITSTHVILTGISRVVLGRHYVTDILVGFAIVYLIKEISTAMFYKHRQVC